MAPFIEHPILPNVEVRVTRAMPPIPPVLEARIDAIWAEAVARVAAGGAGELFNGQVFSIDTITPNRIAGHMTEYRRLVAQVEDPSLFPELGIRSLAACGILCCPSGVVIGRRPASAVYQPGMWQLCPAGSVDAGARRADGTMDCVAQLLTELREELGLGFEAISEITPLCVLEHAGSHVCDFSMIIRTTLDRDTILETHRIRGNGEYDPLRIVAIPDLPAFIRCAGATLVPMTPHLLMRSGLLSAPV